MGGRCQKHMYLQTGCHPAQLQPRTVAKRSLAGGPQRWLPGRHWRPRAEQGHHKQAGDTQRADPQGRPGRAVPILSGSLAELGQREPFRPFLRLLLPPSLPMSSPASFVGRRRQGKGQDLDISNHPHQTPLTLGPFRLGCLPCD